MAALRAELPRARPARRAVRRPPESDRRVRRVPGDLEGGVAGAAGPGASGEGGLDPTERCATDSARALEALEALNCPASFPLSAFSASSAFSAFTLHASTTTQAPRPERIQSPSREDAAGLLLGQILRPRT